MVDLSERATENTKQVVQRSVETASQQAREAAERFTKTLGFTGEDSERLARQSKQNMEAVTDLPLNEWTPLLRSYGGWKVSDGDNETNVHA
ncbi:hypothetical protein [Methylobacterium durans]|uniref:hypothetical protein n=1 Tax=Methylobacterium durans TaxID=2202825 RepID=UPI0018821857|nr:hypothetical protein [Methylobacterium durans]